MKYLRKKENNPNWKGDKVNPRDARLRAERWYGGTKLCEMCGNKAEIHHKDSNPYNNKLDNLQFLCRKHHMQADGRSEKFLFLMRSANPRLKHLVV